MRKIFALFALALLFGGQPLAAQELETVRFDNKDRTMMVYAPRNLDINQPLVISLHGANQDANYQKEQTKWNNCADTAKFVVVYPNAINKFWDVNGTSDVRFIEHIIDLMYDRYQINRNRVYLTGFSLGAMMTYHCIEQMGDKIAAAGPVSGVRFDNREPRSPRRIPLIHTHGTGDDVFKWTGDLNHAAGGYPYIPDYVQKWATYYDLPNKNVISPYPETKPNSIASMTIWTSDDPDDDVQVALLAIEGKGHWHSEDLSAGVSTTQEIWKFCKRYSLGPETPIMTKAEPENLSFDLSSDEHRTYSLTFTQPVDIDALQATISPVGSEDDPSVVVILDKATELEARSELELGSESSEGEPEAKSESNSNVVILSLPEGTTLSDGDYILNVYNILNLEGGKAGEFSLTYTYGWTEVSDLYPSETPSAADTYKGGFLRMMRRGQEVYELTEDATKLSVTNARKRLKKYLDMYEDLLSTAPSVYQKAMDNLEKNIVILEDYLDTTAVNTISIDKAVVSETFYSIDGRPQPQNDKEHKGVSIKVITFTDGSQTQTKVHSR